MPSTVVHLAIGALIATALLDDAFTPKVFALLLLLVAIPDLDTFIGIALEGTHRAALHTVLVPTIAAGAVYYDTNVRDISWLHRRSQHAVRIAWVGIAAYLFAGIGPDLFFNGVNLFYPLHDRFFSVSGSVFLSDQRGFVQTLWQPAQSVQGTTANTHYYTGVDTARGTDPVNVERIFPIANGGFQVLLILTATTISSVRLWETRNQ